VGCSSAPRRASAGAFPLRWANVPCCAHACHSGLTPSNAHTLHATQGRGVEVPRCDAGARDARLLFVGCQHRRGARAAARAAGAALGGAAGARRATHAHTLEQGTSGSLAGGGGDGRAAQRKFTPNVGTGADDGSRRGGGCGPALAARRERPAAPAAPGARGTGVARGDGVRGVRQGRVGRRVSGREGRRARSEAAKRRNGAFTLSGALNFYVYV
jgi:hypothetical protein